MSERQENAKSLTPGVWVIIGPVLGSAVGVGLFFGRDWLRPLLQMPWDDMLLTPAVVGQGVFVTALTLILIEWFALARVKPSVDQLTAQDRTSWAGRLRRQALTSEHPRPRKADRLRALRACHAWINWQVEQRWILYGLLALTPATIGLMMGLRGLRLVGVRSLPFLEFFAPCVVGLVEGIGLYVLGFIVHRQSYSMLDRWLLRCEEFELPPKATATEEVPEQTKSVASAPPTTDDGYPGFGFGAAPVNTRPADDMPIPFEK